MAVADGAILRIVASLLFPDSVIAQNVFYAVFADTGASNDEEDVVDDLIDWVNDMYADLEARMDSDVDLDEIKAYVYDPSDDDWDEIGSGPGTDAFVGAASMAPHGVAALQHANTFDPDVSGHKYWGGFSQSSMDDSDIVGSLITDLVALAITWTTAFVGTATGGDFGPGVWSPTRINFFLFNGTVFTNAQVAYQRRRKPGVGI